VKRSHGLMAVGLIISAWLAIFGDKTPSDRTAEPAPRQSSAGTPPPAARNTAVKSLDKRKHPVAILALQSRATLIGRNETQSPEIFAGAVAPPPPAPVEDVPALAPTLPPLPFTYLGKKYENAKWEVYLAIGDQTYFAREGSVIEQIYAVNSIRPPTMTFTFLPMKKMQTLTIGGAD
jgi:hypothetical protein